MLLQSNSRSFFLLNLPAPLCLGWENCFSFLAHDITWFFIFVPIRTLHRPPGAEIDESAAGPSLTNISTAHPAASRGTEEELSDLRRGSLHSLLFETEEGVFWT